MIDEVGDMPAPHVEEPERFPGGPDALDDQSRYGEIPDGPIGVDLPPDMNPANAEVSVPEITEPDDKSQEPDESDKRAQASEEPETPV